MNSPFKPKPCRHCAGFCGDSGPTCDERYDAMWSGGKAEQQSAALSQPAGVPDRKTLFEQAEVLAACYRLKELVEGVGCERWQNANGFRLKDTQQWVEFCIVVTRMQRLEYPTPAAPAASGGESPSGASVSERARELLAAEYSKCGMQQCATDIKAGVFAAAQQLAVNAIKAALEQKVPSGEVAIVCDWSGADPFPTFIEAEVGGKSVSLEWRDRPDGLKELIVPVTDSAICALEQALTQQHALSSPRQEGEAVAEVVKREPYTDGTPNPMNTLRWSLRSCEDDLPPGTKLYTHPGAAASTQGIEDAVEQKARELFEAQADELSAPWDMQWDWTKQCWRKVARESLLTSPTTGADGGGE